jgi:hypothetical protein
MRAVDVDGGGFDGLRPSKASAMIAPSPGVVGGSKGFIRGEVGGSNALPGVLTDTGALRGGAGGGEPASDAVAAPIAASSARFISLTASARSCSIERAFSTEPR